MGTAIDISHLRSIKDRFSFEGKKGFVTGAAGGIGRSTAAALAELGADVALVDINLERTLQNAEEINKMCIRDRTFARGYFTIQTAIFSKRENEKQREKGVEKI